MITIPLAVTIPTYSFTVDLPSQDVGNVQETPPAIQPQWLFRNDTATWSIVFRTVGAPLDLTGYTLSLIASSRTSTLFSVVGAIVSASDGTASFNLSSSNLATAGEYSCVFTLTYGSQAYTCSPFKLYVLKDIA